jgi:UDP-N-acetylglucosamine/UDP-N-acetylgalactosamine 4-epimerase
VAIIENIQLKLRTEPKRWLITGVSGFIGSNLLEYLLSMGQEVIGLDNFATGHRKNLKEVEISVGAECWKQFTFVEGDIRCIETCNSICDNVDYVLHQAALGSVSRSLEDPLATNETNITGFVNILKAAKDQKVKSFVYAASSSTYGDSELLPKVEHIVGNPLSPYAVTKYANELYASVFSKAYGIKTVGLRYFNVFGRRQDPLNAYSAVIPKWINLMLNDKKVVIFGDGHTSRDFCFIDNVLQANVLAALSNQPDASTVYNIAKGEQTSLNGLFDIIQEILGDRNIYYKLKPSYEGFRPGDVRHSLASIKNAEEQLGYHAFHSLNDGLKETVDWYIAQSTHQEEI